MLQIDDAGWGCLVGGVVVGCYRVPPDPAPGAFQLPDPSILRLSPEDDAKPDTADQDRVRVALVEAVAGLADDAGLPLLIDLRYSGVTVDGGKDQQEAEGFSALARSVQAAAHDLDQMAQQLGNSVARFRH